MSSIPERQDQKKDQNGHLQKLLRAAYLGGFALFVLIYFLAGALPDQYQQWRALLQDVFLNLTIALTISFGSYFLLRPLIQDRDHKSLEDFQQAALDLLTLEKGVCEAGVVRIYENLSDAVLQERLATAKNRICFVS
jgi:hypothetical protein